MSFSTDVKDELLAIDDMSDCCIQAQSYGMLLFARSFSVSSVSFATENTATSERYSQYICDIIGTPPEKSDNDSKMNILSVRTSAERRAVLDYFGHSPKDFALRINRANISGECCFGAFLRGVFLACGSISSPEKNYHLEFVVPFMKLSGDLFSFLEEMGLSPKKVIRKGYHVIYFKDSENIEDLLTAMGATNSTILLINVKINKDIRNHINRRVNFETANIDRAVKAGMAQAEAIKKIAKQKGLDSLPDNLRETALVRLENPEATLSELEELMEGKVSRSGINHRLNRIMKIAEEL
ncbi:MAG: DNA-binding protein WhiA [Clostridia bacterium]|nr:DNA-binding protein WhiA [Clostridia bacterium]